MDLLKKLEGKKTYIVAVVLAVVNLLAQFEVVTPEQVKTINALLGALGLLFLRAGVQRAGEPMRAARALADGMSANFTPPGRPWFDLGSKNKTAGSSNTGELSDELSNEFADKLFDGVKKQHHSESQPVDPKDFLDYEKKRK